MNRREFIRHAAKTGIAAGSAFAIGRNPLLRAEASAAVKKPERFELAAVRGGAPGEMFDQGIAALGGLEHFVKKGRKVLVKPNIGWDAPPERAANTNPELVNHLVRRCLEAGAKEVLVFDHTCNNWKKCYENSGIAAAVKEAGGKIVPGNNHKYYREVAVPEGKKLTGAEVHELVLESDVFINAPVLKDHRASRLTIAMKNLMGVVWDRGYWHRHGLHQCIADFATCCRPALNVVDATAVMRQNGPQGISTEDVAPMKSLILSADIVAADAAAAKLYGLEPESIGYIQTAGEMKTGTVNLESLKIKRIYLN